MPRSSRGASSGAPWLGMMSGPRASMNSATLAASSVNGATVNASSANTTSATCPPARSRSSIASLARACASRVGARSRARMVSDRSNAITSGARVCHNGRSCWCRLGPASATIASAMPISAAQPAHARRGPAASSSKCGSRCASTASRHALRAIACRCHHQANSGNTSSASNHSGRRNWRSAPIGFMRGASPRAGRAPQATARHPAATDSVRPADARPAPAAQPAPAYRSRHRCQRARARHAPGRSGRR